MAESAKRVMLEANGITLNAVDMGAQDMPAIVLLAGWPQTLRAWRFVQPTLRREGYRVIAIDPPGIGGSDMLPEGEMADTAGVADRIVAALRKTSVERFTLPLPASSIPIVVTEFPHFQRIVRMAAAYAFTLFKLRLGPSLDRLLPASAPT
jgi:hypothetical protein